jgi:acetoin utilization deacetylase AcuC-like enzyme
VTPGWSPLGRVPVFFDPAAVPDGGATAFPLRKLGMLADLWKSTRADTVEFLGAGPASRDDLVLVHDADHVDGLLSGRVRNPMTGSDPSGALAAMLDVGAFVAAARSAATSGWFAAVIGGGFHHAGPSRAHAFCTFNGLMVAAAILLRDGLATRVGILDLDAHFGDGTQAILDRVPWADRVDHYGFAMSCSIPTRWMTGPFGCLPGSGG